MTVYLLAVAPIPLARTTPGRAFYVIGAHAGMHSNAAPAHICYANFVSRIRMPVPIIESERRP
jgi:hypothetical protein